MCFGTFKACSCAGVGWRKNVKTRNLIRRHARIEHGFFRSPATRSSKKPCAWLPLHRPSSMHGSMNSSDGEKLPYADWMTAACQRQQQLLQPGKELQHLAPICLDVAAPVECRQAAAGKKILESVSPRSRRNELHARNMRREKLWAVGILRC